MDKSIILDTDIASAFAKINQLELLSKLLHRYSVFITPRIYEELMAPLDFGYTYPLDIFDRINVLHPTHEESKDYQLLILENRKLGKGELEAICICKRRGCVFSSMDRAALRYAAAVGVETIDLYSILRAFWESGILLQKDVEGIIEALEDKDKIPRIDKNKIFD
ncbi:MAG: hypothetical protein A4E44_00244 [Methanosaeta sp. PtaB.Bin018]|nr:MAG: hypothetical protein A4E44_00244 [Methanosaeta sp. PtaB.Bin018]